MIFINRPETDPYFNIAAEEYFLKNSNEDIVMIWRSSPAIVVGKHQNTIAEVNMDWISENQIPVIRRISGGGTVYHDEGNLNFTLIRSEERKDRMIDFRSFTKPVVSFLAEFSIHADFEGKNNLVIGGEKFSGNSAHVYRNRIIHHGTLLFETNLEKLNFSISPNIANVEDKAVQSIRAKVTNISAHLDQQISIKEFASDFEKYLHNYFSVSNIRNISTKEKEAINALVKEKYKTWEWNYGYSPDYTVLSTINLSGTIISCRVMVKKGILNSVVFQDSSVESQKLKSLADKLIGLPHDPYQLDPYIRKIVDSDASVKLLKELLFTGKK
jgi:lipoate---protein ligase